MSIKAQGALLVIAIWICSFVMATRLLGSYIPRGHFAAIERYRLGHPTKLVEIEDVSIFVRNGRARPVERSFSKLLQVKLRSETRGDVTLSVLVSGLLTKLGFEEFERSRSLNSPMLELQQALKKVLGDKTNAELAFNLRPEHLRGELRAATKDNPLRIFTLLEDLTIQHAPLSHM
ncbi:MAG: hypothetical protein H6619_01775 [Deltaproteobacteria bacterium]|nr:hypothetical protein [Deltaproteobacteria bacterium]